MELWISAAATGTTQQCTRCSPSPAARWSSPALLYRPGTLSGLEPVHVHQDGTMVKHVTAFTQRHPDQRACTKPAGTSLGTLPSPGSPSSPPHPAAVSCATGPALRPWGQGKRLGLGKNRPNARACLHAVDLRPAETPCHRSWIYHQIPYNQLAAAQAPAGLVPPRRKPDLPLCALYRWFSRPDSTPT